MSPLRRSGLLADEFFLVAHDDVSGKPRLHPRVTGIALAGALLGELLLYGRIDVRPGPENRGPAVWLTERVRVGEALADSILGQILAEGRPRPVLAWLTHLGQTASRDVGERLAAVGLVEAARSRLPRREVRWVPVDSSTAAWPATRLRMLLSRQEQMTLPDATLAGIALPCGLGQQILWNTAASARQYLDYLECGSAPSSGRTRPPVRAVLIALTVRLATCGDRCRAW